VLKNGKETLRKEHHMPHATLEAASHVAQLRTALKAHAKRITEKLEELVLREDWEALKSVLRVLDAHARANELRSQGQPARAHLWLVGVGRKRRPQKPVKKPTAPLPAA
jgi:hypothetical protein